MKFIHEKLKSLEELYQEEKDLFLKVDYSLSDEQESAKSRMTECLNMEDLEAAYYEVLNFFEEENEQNSVHIQELDALYPNLRKLLVMIEESIDMNSIVSTLVKHFTKEAMIQFSIYSKDWSLILNGSDLSISIQDDEKEEYDFYKIDKLKDVIIRYRESLYAYSRQQENIDIESEEECFGAIEGVLFSICDNSKEEKLHKFYSMFKDEIYAIITSETEKSIKDRQLEKMCTLLSLSKEEIEKNSKMLEDTDTMYYLNPNGLSIIVDRNLNYLLTSYPIDKEEKLLSVYYSIKTEDTNIVEPVVLMDNMEQKIDELNNTMIDEINHDYQADKSIGNIFDLSESLIVETDLDLFWRRVSSDTLGYLMVKELEDNNSLDMDRLKEYFTTFQIFQKVCTTTEVSSKNKNIVNIVSMLRQAPEKTLKTIYEIICDNLKIEKKFGDNEKINFKYNILSDTYYNFEISFPFEVEGVVKNSESSFKVGDINIMLAKCASLDKIGERANQWLENSAKTNSQTLLHDLDREYYLRGSQRKILEKQLEKNNRRRVYKFIYFNESMIIFAYSSSNPDLSDIVDNAITSISILN